MSDNAPIFIPHDPFVARLEALVGMAHAVDEIEDEIAKEILTRAMALTLTTLVPIIKVEPEGNVVPIKRDK